MDLVSNEHKHNEANGEDNRDGHGDNMSWNNGTEGVTRDRDILADRRRDVEALLSTLFASRGTIMLTMGDEAGRSQRGNNNAYAQDNEITWMDWAALDEALVEHTAMLSALRKRFSVFSETHLFSGDGDGDGDIEWISPSSQPMQVSDWENPANPVLGFVLKTGETTTGEATRLAIIINRSHTPESFALPGSNWCSYPKSEPWDTVIPARSVRFCIEN
jgi:glycogen operon protein